MIDYRFLLDSERDYTFSGYVNDISSYVKSAKWGFGLQTPYESVGGAAYLDIVLENSSGDFSQEDTSAIYYNRLKVGVLIRVQARYDGINWINLCTLKIKSVKPSFYTGNKSELLVNCTDILPDFLSSEYLPPLQTNVSSDEALLALHRGVNGIYPYESYYQYIGFTSIGDGKAPFYGDDWVDFETGEASFVYLGDNLDRGNGVSVQNYVRDVMSAEAYGIYYFSPRSERFKFLSRYHASDEAIAWYLNDSVFTLPNYNYGAAMVNDLTVTFSPRAIGSEGSILWSSDSVPFAVPPSTPKKINIRFRDPNNESASVGALEIISPVSVTDYTANELADGTGFNYTHRLEVTISKGASGAELTLFSGTTGTIYCTFLQVRGTPITSYNPEKVVAKNDSSIYNNWRVTKPETIYGIDDIDVATNYANFKVNVFGEPQNELDAISILTPSDDPFNIASQVINRTIGDVINIVDSVNGHDNDYMIVAEQHTLNTSDNSLNTRYVLRPTNRGNLFILGTSTSNAGDVLAF